MVHSSDIRWHLPIVRLPLMELLYFPPGTLRVQVVHTLDICVGSLMAHGAENNTIIFKLS